MRACWRLDRVADFLILLCNVSSYIISDITDTMLTLSADCSVFSKSSYRTCHSSICGSPGREGTVAAGIVEVFVPEQLYSLVRQDESANLMYTVEVFNFTCFFVNKSCKRFTV